MTKQGSPFNPKLPIPIFQISPGVERYMLYDADVITWLRKNHNILGVLVGTLPQVPQQNVFLGLPLELQPEEARLLVTEGIAYVVDDLSWHRKNVANGPTERTEQMRADLRREGLRIADGVGKKKQDKTHKHWEGVNGKGKARENEEQEDGSAKAEESLFQDISTHKSQPSSIASPQNGLETQPWTIIPTTAESFLGQATIDAASKLPAVNRSSYALFEHLHRLGYFMTPGLRFGCQYSVYPGDPLRFHSHFLATDLDWDEDVDLLDIIGGGRLSTGVKKGWMIGGVEPAKKADDDDNDGRAIETGKASHGVRTFCIEWGGM